MAQVERTTERKRRVIALEVEVPESVCARCGQVELATVTDANLAMSEAARESWVRGQPLPQSQLALGASAWRFPTHERLTEGVDLCPTCEPIVRRVLAEALPFLSASVG